ncbi:MAG: hypothetical protein WBF47_20980 [Xanthobacteraceae bacterium]
MSATAAIQAAPNDIAMTHSATEAMIQEALLSIEEDGECIIKGYPASAFY